MFQVSSSAVEYTPIEGVLDVVLEREALVITVDKTVLGEGSWHLFLDGEYFQTIAYDIYEYPISSDALLKSLVYDDTPIADFAPNIYNYNVTLPAGTSTVPVVTYETQYLAVSNVTITDAAELPGVTSIAVTAEDEETTATYTVTFSVAEDDDATLSNLTVSGIAVTGFSAATLAYNVELPVGTVDVPEVAATTTDTNAIAVVTPAEALPGTTTVDVTAEDGTTVLQYTIAFTVAVE